MKIQWVATILLSSALAVGCGGSHDQTAQNPQNPPPAASAPTTPPADQTQPAPPAPDATAVQPPGGSSAETGAPTTRSRTRRDSNLAPSAPADPEAERPSATAEAPAPPRPAFRDVTIPAGTALPLDLQTALSSESSAVETPVHARVRQAVVVDGVTAIPAGSTVTGTVTAAAPAGRVKGKAHLAIRFDEITLRGTRERINMQPLTYEAEATKGEDATKIGAGAGIGAAIGGLLGGGSGAAKGAAIGGAAGTGVVLGTKGKEVNLAVGTNIAATLASALTVRVPGD
jgi:hypothetical protein